MDRNEIERIKKSAYASLRAAHEEFMRTVGNPKMDRWSQEFRRRLNAKIPLDGYRDEQASHSR